MWVLNTITGLWIAANPIWIPHVSMQCQKNTFVALPKDDSPFDVHATCVVSCHQALQEDREQAEFAEKSLPLRQPDGEPQCPEAQHS